MNNTFGPLFEWNYTNDTNHTYHYNHTNDMNQMNNSSSQTDILVILVSISPLLLGAFIGLNCLIYGCICLPLHLKIKNLQYKMYDYIESLNSPIVNNKLNKKYIKKLNAENEHKIKNKTDIQCSICIEDITKKKTLVLDCGHAFCKTCIQTWIKTQSSIGQQIECPMCRQHIIREEDMIEKEHTVINIDYDSDSSTRTTLSDL